MQINEAKTALKESFDEKQGFRPIKDQMIQSKNSTNILRQASMALFIILQSSTCKVWSHLFVISVDFWIPKIVIFYFYPQIRVETF